MQAVWFNAFDMLHYLLTADPQCKGPALEQVTRVLWLLNYYTDLKQLVNYSVSLALFKAGVIPFNFSTVYKKLPENQPGMRVMSLSKLKLFQCERTSKCFTLPAATINKPVCLLRNECGKTWGETTMWRGTTIQIMVSFLPVFLRAQRSTSISIML